MIVFVRSYSAIVLGESDDSCSGELHLVISISAMRSQQKWTGVGSLWPLSRMSSTAPYILVLSESNFTSFFTGV